jgi:RimJ/RimL family protein N-acetyltransferase
VEDAGEILRWRREPSAGRYQPLRAMARGELEARLAERAARAVDAELVGEVLWIVEVAGEPVGWVRLAVTSREHGLGDIGYTIGEGHRGRGFATAAVRAVLGIAFAPDGVDLWRVEAVAAVGNVASRRVLERAGLRCEGIARGLLVIDGERVDHARYGVLRPEWEARRRGCGERTGGCAKRRWPAVAGGDRARKRDGCQGQGRGGGGG